ncbi:hypothetical protein [Anaeromyxobacter oryzae]|uniref:DUF1127 domain-containing protein n=1 Tax=Anaeromyxobacter oryzae TaxID=2918170 RepID=A0ABM7WZM5_9BACT|nr:hypothetical protein [Anaeromyxobacter oryzae]BDG04991.1 hypothetical protein AMOR_39870 [Anaeromyxobacter oryzae]
MRHDDRIRLAKTAPPDGMYPGAARMWRRLAPLVDATGLVIRPVHAVFAFRALCENVAVHRAAGLPVNDEAGWLRTFGLTVQDVERALR